MFPSDMAPNSTGNHSLDHEAILVSQPGKVHPVFCTAGLCVGHMFKIYCLSDHVTFS